METTPSRLSSLFRGRHFNSAIIVLCVRWCSGSVGSATIKLTLLLSPDLHHNPLTYLSK